MFRRRAVSSWNPRWALDPPDTSPGQFDRLSILLSKMSFEMGAVMNVDKEPDVVEEPVVVQEAGELTIIDSRADL